jgi:hypothetical protein
MVPYYGALYVSVEGKKYDMCFPKMACTMIIGVDNGSNDCDGSILGGKEVMFLPFKYCNWYESNLSFPYYAN